MKLYKKITRGGLFEVEDTFKPQAFLTVYEIANGSHSYYGPSYTTGFMFYCPVPFSKTEDVFSWLRVKQIFFRGEIPHITTLKGFGRFSTKSFSVWNKVRKLRYQTIQFGKGEWYE